MSSRWEYRHPPGPSPGPLHPPGPPPGPPPAPPPGPPPAFCTKVAALLPLPLTASLPRPGGWGPWGPRRVRGVAPVLNGGGGWRGAGGTAVAGGSAPSVARHGRRGGWRAGGLEGFPWGKVAILRPWWPPRHTTRPSTNQLITPRHLH